MDISESLKKIRMNKGLTQKQFSEGVLSPSYYSKVEEGKNKLSAMYLFELLEKNEVSLNEFSYILKDYRGETTENIFFQTKYLYYTNNSNELEVIYKNLEKEDTLLKCVINNLILEIKEEPLNIEQLVFLKEKLFETPSWGHYEFNLFCLATNLLTLEESSVLAIHIIRDMNKYSGYLNYTQDFIVSFNNLTKISLCANNITQAQYYLSLAEELNNKSFFLNET